jgi:hypothetical protein
VEASELHHTAETSATCFLFNYDVLPEMEKSICTSNTQKEFKVRMLTSASRHKNEFGVRTLNSKSDISYLATATGYDYNSPCVCALFKFSKTLPCEGIHSDVFDFSGEWYSALP